MKSKLVVPVGIQTSLKKIYFSLLMMVLAFTSSAQVYTTKADGNWNDPATWVGGLVPGATINAGRVVNIQHKVTFNLSSDLRISGTLNVTDTLSFPSSYDKKVQVLTGGLLAVTNGVFIQSLNLKSDLESDGGRIAFTNAHVYVSMDFRAKRSSRRIIKDSKLWVGQRYEIDGSGTSFSIDTIQGSLVEVSTAGSGGMFEIKGGNTLRIANALIKVQSGCGFRNNSGGTISVLSGAHSNYGFDFLKVTGDLENDGNWVARIDAACVNGQIKGSQMAAIDFIRAQDCGGVAIGDAPELIFNNPTLVWGQARKQGAIYRFNNVVSGVDATIKLKKFSRSDIVMQDIDLATMGWSKAFQPQFGLPGYVNPNQNWFIDFELKFYQAGTNNLITLPKVDMTALDVDGDGVSVKEYAVFQNPSNVIYSTVSYLAEQPAGTAGQSFTCPVDGLLSPLLPCVLCGGDGKAGMWNLTDCASCNATGILYSLCNHGFEETNGNVLEGPVENFINIDTAATQVMATYQYADVSTISFRYGARSGIRGSNGAGVRLNSLWFRQFNLAPPSILPVKLHNFDAFLNQKDVNLVWTADEENVSHYVVQQSIDGRNFSDIAIVFANNNSSASTYRYKDANPSSATGSLFYRLLTLDKGKEGGSYSETRVIKLGVDAAIKLTTYPNPVTDQVRITLPASWQGKPVTIQLYNANGNLMQAMQSGSASQTETMQLGKVPKGVYLLKAMANGEVAQQQLVKN